MKVYRLCNEKHSSLDGEGASKYGGAWNSKGKPAIYTSGTISLALLEILVHMDYDLIPNDYVLLTLNIPDSFQVKYYQNDSLSRAEAITYGNNWLINKESLILSVPSFIIQTENNYLLNPNHPDFKQIEIISKEVFNFDERIFKKKAFNLDVLNL